MVNKELTYTLMKTPSYESNSKNYNKFLCKDNKVHIRFKDYEGKQIISGFENKLTFLITYLFQKQFLYTHREEVLKETSNDFEYIWNKYSKLFIQSTNFRFLNSKLYSKIPSFVSIELTPNYRVKKFKNAWRQFGSMKNSMCPLMEISNEGNLNIFIDKLGVSLNDFIFDNSIELAIVDKRDSNFDEKFINRNIVNRFRKEKTIQEYIINASPKLENEELWGIWKNNIGC